MHKHELKRYLSTTQAAAWVVYRDAEFVNLCTDPDGYHGETFWPTRTRYADEQDLALALVEGRVRAFGLRKGKSDFTPVPAIDWEAMRVAPQYPEKYHHRFADIRVERDELLKAFPPLAQGRGAGRPPTVDRELIEELAKRYDGKSLEKMAQNVVADYIEVKGPISESSVKRHLRRIYKSRSKIVREY